MPLTECHDLVFLRPSPISGAGLIMLTNVVFLENRRIIYSDELDSRYS